MPSAAPDLVPAAGSLTLRNYQPEPDSFREAVRRGLAATPKTLPCKFLYDARGSELFDAICALDEYYPTRTEMAIMQTRIAEMAARIGPRALVVEYGSGSSTKTRILLDHLEAPAGYVPIDISREHLLGAAERLAETFPGLPVFPVCADYTAPFAVPDPGVPVRRTVAFFPGSTIGNFGPAAAARFMAQIAEVADGLLIGADLRKDVAVLEAAYDDAEGVTAAFNKNLLARMNRELDATFDLDAFAHRAAYNAEEGCVEMHLVSRKAQEVRVGDASFRFAEGEAIRTERSYKYTLGGFAALAEEAGFSVEEVWMDDGGLFSVQYLKAV